MKAIPHAWSSVASDQPIPLLGRQLISGEEMLLARVELAAGCHVAVHQHQSEQMAVVISGRVRWTLGEPGGEQTTYEMGGGEVMQLPAWSWHGVDALEDTLIIDILSPPGAMGVDRQGKE